MRIEVIRYFSAGWFNKQLLLVTFSIACIISLSITEVRSAQKKWVQHDDILSISFPDEQNGWACGRWGTILRTLDGGLNWKRLNSGTDFTLTTIFFIDPKNGWSVGSQGTILHTTDGGETWAKQKSPVDYYLMDIFFVSALKGWIVTEDTHILYTENGGQTWQVQFNDEVYMLKAVSFSDANHGWAVGEYGYVYHTVDGGGSWEKQGGHFDINEDTGELEGGASLYDVIAVDSQNGWAVGLDGKVITTMDSGKTWQELETGFPKTPIFAIGFDEADTIVIGGKEACYFSRDNGQSWEKALFDPKIDYSWVYDLTSVSPSHFVAGGENGAIYHTKSPELWKRVQY